MVLTEDYGTLNKNEPCPRCAELEEELAGTRYERDNYQARAIGSEEIEKELLRVKAVCLRLRKELNDAKGTWGDSDESK